MRLNVGAGEKLMVGGFIIEGNEPKRVVVRALGPSLGHAGVADALGDPLLELKDAAGNNVARNASWRDSQSDELLAIGLAPNEPGEAALVQTLAPGVYTANVTGERGGSGVGLLEIYDVDAAASSRLMNISSRGHVGDAEDAMIGGFIVGGSTGFTRLMVRGVGPSLAAAAVTEPLANPALTVRDSNGELIAANDDWRAAQAGEIEATALAPTLDAEAASILSVVPGAYTTMLQGGSGDSGVGVLELYRLPNSAPVAAAAAGDLAADIHEVTGASCHRQHGTKHSYSATRAGTAGRGLCTVRSDRCAQSVEKRAVTMGAGAAGWLCPGGSRLKISESSSAVETPAGNRVPLCSEIKTLRCDDVNASCRPKFQSQTRPLGLRRRCAAVAFSLPANRANTLQLTRLRLCHQRRERWQYSSPR
jgi:hypothetical protein